MNTDLSQAPVEEDIIIYLNAGWPPIIAGYFQGNWVTFEGKEIPLERIEGWARIPHYPGYR